MTTLLKINASLFSANGQSSQLAERFAAAWQASHPGARVVALEAQAVRPKVGQPAPARRRAVDRAKLLPVGDGLLLAVKRRETIRELGGPY